MGHVRLTPKGRRWMQGGHSWIYRDDLAESQAEAGELVAVQDAEGRTHGWGSYSAASKIALRLVSREKEPPGEEFWRKRVARALELRVRAGLAAPEGAARLCAGDADGIPGLVVDRYASVLVVQAGTLFAERIAPQVVALVRELSGLPVTCVVERADASVRKLEGLELRTGILEGALPELLLVREEGLVYEVDVLAGHKTGHYLDQRDNRRRAAQLGRGTSVLDVFSYDGLFGLHAARAGAERVLCLDQSVQALERARRNAERNGLAQRFATEKVDALHDLRERVAREERWGLVIVDPPAFAKNRAQVEGAARGYVELNRRALELVLPLGHLVSASCSYNVRAWEFVDFLAQASVAARRESWLEELTGAAPDHPHLLTLPETHYLKCAFVRVG
ncbi:MAG: class I SAM-dependent rRNA methyltransferase [Planctomycetes bacterium]|nr:class I SAM-dependent rRNA methyltransferase [Planctomycetota bacterium]